MNLTESTVTVVLAGGTGTRLAPLTRDRAKPAVPFGGKYRIIDFALANCLHSGLRRVLVLTQYKSHSLQKHLRDGWSIFNPELGEYITVVPPQMRRGDDWYRGTADAIHQNLYMLERSGAKQVLILSADHIYRMDYAAMLQAHRQRGADVTIAAMEVPLEKAKSFGVMAVDEEERIVAFEEKPAQPTPLPGDRAHALASMGIYVFSIEILIAALESDAARAASSHDFGKDILPRLLGHQQLHAYRFGGNTGRVTADRYWRDVGTLDAYYQANMDLLEPLPPLDLYQEDWMIRSYQAQTPPARTVPGKFGAEGISINSIVAGGVVISGGSVQHSILFPKVQVGNEAFVEDAILMQNVVIGEGCRVRRCIIDKDVVVPPRRIDRLRPAARQGTLHAQRTRDRGGAQGVSFHLSVECREATGRCPIRLRSADRHERIEQGCCEDSAGCCRWVMPGSPVRRLRRYWCGSERSPEGGPCPSPGIHGMLSALH